MTHHLNSKPARQAALGWKVVVEILDYRGVPFLAAAILFERGVYE